MLLAGAAPGQQEDLPEVFSEVIDVRVVNIEIVASTGGVPMINAHRDAALARVVADTRSYYWLGFEPQRREDDDLQLRRRKHSYVITVHDPLTGTNLTSTGEIGPN